jgi:hypothetical protein
MSEEFTATELHRMAMSLIDLSWDIKRGRKFGDVVDVLRKAMYFERQAYVRCRDKMWKRIFYKSYKSIQVQIRRRTWRKKRWTE